MSFFSFHLQTPVPGWLDAVAEAAAAGRPFRLIKLFQIEKGAIVKTVSPQTVTIFRHHISHQQPYLDQAAISDADADQAADDYIAHFQDSLNQHGGIDYAESLNETYASQNPANQAAAVAFDRAFIRRLAVHCPHVKPIVYTAAPGNVDHPEHIHLLPLAEECEAAGGAFGYHNYWPVHHGHSFAGSPQHAHDFHMRWEHADQVFMSHGVRVKWMFGESGPILSGPDGYGMDPWTGWLSPDVYGGQRAPYLDDLEIVDALMANTTAGQEGRIIGATLFTSGWAGWDWFQIHQPLIDDITQYLINSPLQPPAPPLPPPAPAEQVRAITAANLRRAPRLLPDTRLTTLPAGTILEALGQAEGDQWNGSKEWVQVAGYIHRNLVEDL